MLFTPNIDQQNQIFLQFLHWSNQLQHPCYKTKIFAGNQQNNGYFMEQNISATKTICF